MEMTKFWTIGVKPAMPTEVVAPSIRKCLKNEGYNRQSKKLKFPQTKRGLNFGIIKTFVDWRNESRKAYSSFHSKQGKF